ncbi:MAG: dihydrodipicolinate synthase family protein [Rhizobiales bacterium]|nr:dihydrodipicolinate synthase family protein [Hyphomicrobiales bacterium]
MTTKPGLFSGVLVPALTPFKQDLSPDAARFTALCKYLLAQGANGLAVFGTTSEGNSISVAERNQLLDHLAAEGIDTATLLPGTGACALTDAVELTRHAVDIGAGGVLVLPPFYYKNQSNDGYYAYFSEIIQRIGDAKLKLYLYHFPQMSAAPVSIDLIARLHGDYPDTVVGLKDSSGNWDGTRRMIAEFPEMAIFPSSETLVNEGLQLGAAGCISATANVQVGAIRQLIEAHGTPEANALHDQVAAVRSVFEGYPLVSALKATLARDTGDASWHALRPPLTPLAAEQAAELANALDSIAGYAPVTL